MTLTLSLTSEQEEWLNKVASDRGVAVETLASELMDKALAEVTPATKKTGWVFGLHEGQGWISDDFNDPLPDSFWFGEE